MPTAKPQTVNVHGELEEFINNQTFSTQHCFIKKGEGVYLRPGTLWLSQNPELTVSSSLMWLFHRDENIVDAPPSAQKRSMISQHTLPPIHTTEEPPTSCCISGVFFDLAIVNNKQQNATKTSSQSMSLTSNYKLLEIPSLGGYRR